MEFSPSDIKIIRSRDRKTCALIVKPDGEVVMRVPFFLPDSAAGRLALQRMNWIIRKRRAALEAASRRLNVGAKIPYLGNDYKVVLREGSAEVLSFDGREFSFGGGALPADAAKLFGAWYRRQAEEIIGARLNCYAVQAGLSYAGFALSDARCRWGVCGKNNVLRFNWRLAMAPLFVVDYVVAHELAHLRRRDHSRIFWKIVEDILPGYREGRKWLKANGSALFFELERIGHSA